MAACPICALELRAYYGSVGGRDAERFDCHRCCEFDLTGTVVSTLPTRLRKLPHGPALMSHSVCRLAFERKPPLISTDTVESILSDDRLPPVSQQVDDLILFLGDHQSAPDAPQRFSLHVLGAWVGTSLTNGPLNGVHWLLSYLEYEKLVTYVQPREESGVGIIGLSIPGWRRYEELKRQRNESRTAFMAVQFGDAELTEVVEVHFRQAVEQAGFLLRVLTEPQPAGLIDNHMRAAILSARFMIADLTHDNQNAYWEAGFGEGRGIPVIYSCKNDKWAASKTRFDTNHMNTIIWDPSDLGTAAKRLAATIRVTLPDEAIPEQG